MNKKVYKIVCAGLVSALVAVLTMFVKVPMAIGYIHIGDAMIVIGVFLLGFYGVVGGAIGSMMADIFTSYFQYALPTLIIKFAMGMIIYLFVMKKDSVLMVSIGVVVGSLAMVAGYFAVEVFMYGLEPAAASVLFSFIQAGFAVAIGVSVCAVMKATKLKEKIRL